MKIFTEKSIAHKIIIALVIVILLEFMIPNISSAKENKVAIGVGGILFEPIKDFLLFLADGLIQITQEILFGIDESFVAIEYDNTGAIVATVGAIAGLIGGAVAVVIGIAGAPFSGGLSLAAVVAGIKLVVTTVTVAVASGVVASYIASNALPEKLLLPLFLIGPQEIFEGEMALLDVNFFSPHPDMQVTTATGKDVTQKSSAAILKPTISKWYYALRNFAIVALLSILVYMGIRIIISSSSEDKAKYKQRFLDWLVAMCLLFFMHYIMAFAVTVTEEITKAVIPLNDVYGVVIGTENGDGADDGRDLKKYVFTSDGSKVFADKDKDGTISKQLHDVGGIFLDETSGMGETLTWPTNLMGKARIELQLEPSNKTESAILIRKFGYTVIYLALVMYTILFLFRYLKRLMILAFLTMIAPLMAMTYPLDKIKDASAQGFNTWLREYLFNLLIQPVHLVLYTVLIGSSMELAADNLIYAIAALGFILEAEKLVRKFFGFDKATTVAGGTALGGALVMQGINSVSKMFGKGGTKSEKQEQNSANSKSKIRTANSGNNINNLLNNTRSGTGSGTGPTRVRPTRVRPTPARQTSARQTSARRTLARPTPTGQASARSTSARPTSARQATVRPTSARTTSPGQTLTRPTSSGQTPVRRIPVRQVSASPTPPAPTPTRSRVRNNAFLNATKYIGPKLAKGVAKAGLKWTLGGAAAIAGATAGLVSDDFSNVGKWGAAGATAGLLAAKGISDMPERLDGFGDNMVNEAENVYEAAHTKDEIEARQNKILDAQFRRNPEKIKLYQEGLKLSSKAEAQKVMKNDAQKYREYGIDDDKLIIKAMKQPGFGTNRSSDERLLLASYAKQVGGSKKELELLEKGLKKRKVPQREIDKYSNAIRDINEWA